MGEKRIEDTIRSQKDPIRLEDLNRDYGAGEELSQKYPDFKGEGCSMPYSRKEDA